MNSGSMGCVLKMLRDSEITLWKDCRVFQGQDMVISLPAGHYWIILLDKCLCCTGGGLSVNYNRLYCQTAPKRIRLRSMNPRHMDTKGHHLQLCYLGPLGNTNQIEVKLILYFKIKKFSLQFNDMLLTLLFSEHSLDIENKGT